jgi:hypothetical protein
VRTRMQAVAAATATANLGAPHDVGSGQEVLRSRVKVSQQGWITSSPPPIALSSQNVILDSGHAIDQSLKESCSVCHDEQNLGQYVGEGADSYVTQSVQGVSAGVRQDPDPVQGAGSLDRAPAQHQGALHRHEMPTRSVQIFPGGAPRLTGVSGFDLSQHDAELKEMLARERVCALLPVI